MKIIFDNYYRTFNNNNDNRIYDARLNNPNADVYRNNYIFDKQYFSQLLSQDRYEDAAKYAEQFHFNDAAKNDEHIRNIAKLRREGEQKAALKKEMSPEDFNLYNLGLALRRNGDISNLLTNVNHFTNNVDYYGLQNKTPADKLVSCLNMLGSTDSRYATSIGVTFAAPVQKTFGIDMLAKDNPNTAQAFYERLGMNEAELEANGIEIIHENGDYLNGKTTLKFSKTNPLALKLIANLGEQGGYGQIDESIKGYDAKGNEISNNLFENINGSSLESHNKATITELQTIIKSANDKLDQTEDLIKQRDKLRGINSYSQLRVGPLLTDEIYQIQTLYQKGKLSNEQYNYHMATAQQHMFEILASIPNSQEMYSNFKNPDKKDESLQEINNIDRKDLQEYLSYNLDKRPKEITLQTAVQDGKYGVLVTINAHEKEKDTDVDIDERRIQVFMPGLQSEMVQDVFDKDPASRAVTEINSIKDYGYKYKLDDNETIQANSDGTFNLTRNGQNVTIDQKYAEQKIHESILTRDAKHEIVDAYLTPNGKIADVAGYRAKAKEYAIRAANEIYSDLPEIGTNTQSSIYSAEEIFSEAKVTDKNTQYEMWNKILAARNMYELLLKELTNYM